VPEDRENDGARNVTARKIKPIRDRIVLVQEYTSQEIRKTAELRSFRRERPRKGAFVFLAAIN
jgi:hypothetical protein